MKITKLEIEGYRSLRHIAWEPGDLNVVIGPNASGKSNLLSALELLSVAAKGGLGELILREGGIRSVVWDGEVDQIKLRLKTTPLGDEKDVHRKSFTYILNLKNRPSQSAYNIDYELLGNFYRVEIKQEIEPYKYLERSSYNAVMFDENLRQFVAQDDSISEEETLLSTIQKPFPINHLISGYKNELTLWGIYQNINTLPDSTIRLPMVTRLEKRLNSNGQNLITVLHTLYSENRDFKRNVNDAMKVAFGDEFEEIIFPPAADQRIQLRIRWRSLKREQSAADLSDGTLRFLYLLAILANPDPPPLIAIDEPETGLHPRMLPIIVDFAKEAALKSQVIFTTHSPEFLHAFREPPTVTVADWKNGETILRVLSGDELQYWLKEYTLGDLYRSGELEAME